MPNQDHPRGFIIHGDMDHRHLLQTTIDVSNATAMFIGTLVKFDNDGNISASGTTEEKSIGIIINLRDADGQATTYLPATTAGSALVLTDPNQQFIIQCAGTLAATDVGENADINATQGGSTSSGRANTELSETTSTSTAQFRIIDKVNTPGNEWGLNVDVVVRPNEHGFTNAAGI